MNIGKGQLSKIAGFFCKFAGEIFLWTYWIFKITKGYISEKQVYQAIMSVKYDVR